MMKIFDLYGIQVSSLDEARRLVEPVIGGTFVPHESSYHCGDYYRIDLLDDVSFILQKNHDSLDDMWTEEAFKEMPFLLYVSCYGKADEYKIGFNMYSGVIKHLRRSELLA